jgi:hypothetical protein
MECPSIFCVLFNFFHQCFVFSLNIYRGLSSLWLVLFIGILYFYNYWISFLISISDHSQLACSTDFYMLILCLATLLSSFFFFFGGVFGGLPYIRSCHLQQCEFGCFFSTSYTPSFCTSFFCLTALVRTFNTRFNKSGESGHPCLLSDLREKPFSCFPLNIMLAVVLL